MSRRGWAYFVAVGIIWGLPYLLIKISVREISPPLLVFIRTGGASVVLVPLAAARGALLPALRRWRAVLVYTCVELAVPWVLLTNAERRLPSSFTGLLIASVPLAAAVLAWVTGSDRVDLRRLAGLLLGLGGVGLLVGFQVAGSQVLAVLSLLVVAIGYASGPWVVAHRLNGVPPLGVIACSLCFCALGYAPAALLTLPTRTLSASVAGSAAGLTVVCTIVAFLLFFALIAEVGALRATLITYVNPAVAVVLGVAILGEHFGVGSGVGFVLILGGCFLASRPLQARPNTTGARRSPATVPSDGAHVHGPAAGPPRQPPPPPPTPHAG
jgi:drug/metabolite transporter (DMT)-like permease